MLRVAAGSLVARETLMLAVLLVLVITLSSVMARAGVMQDFVTVARERFPRRLAVGLLPAVIGLIPMPGGAWFSAPLVDSLDAEGTLPPLLKGQTNYWFRHIWEAWWPLYPGVILALEITGLEVWQFGLVQLPLSLVVTAIGWWLFLRRFPPGSSGGRIGSAAAPARPAPVLLPFLRLTAPIATVIVGYAAVRILLPAAASVSRFLPMMPALLLAFLVVQLQRRLTVRDWARCLFSGRTALLVLLVLPEI